MDTTPDDASSTNHQPGATTLTAGPTEDASTPPATPPPAADRLHRVGDERMVAGVAGGLADYFDVDPTIVRIGFVALAFLGGLAVPLYLAGWLLIPEDGAEQSVAEELIARERDR
jgi:phage shock protein PspC (stress-responsive transcriptional regulator)